MAKGEDAVRRKKSKVNRKRLQKQDSSASVSARVAAIIASKKRRKSGKRRMCEVWVLSFIACIATLVRILRSVAEEILEKNKLKENQ